jgi:hypothetical protein
LAKDAERKYEYKHAYGTNVYQELLFGLRVAHYHIADLQVIEIPWTLSPIKNDVSGSKFTYVFFFSVVFLIYHKLSLSDSIRFARHLK